MNVKDYVKSNGHVDWSRRNEVVGRIDYKAALHDLGMEVVSKPSAKGFVRVKLNDQDKKPSGGHLTERAIKHANARTCQVEL